MELEPYPVSPNYYTAFGSIVQQFARHEYLMQGIISAVIGVNVADVSMLTVELSYRARREALLSVIRAKPLPRPQLERIESFLAELHRHSGLRNAIAHNIWKEGRRPGSIRPLGLSVRGGKVSFKGIADNEPDYTVSQLFKIANDLTTLHDKFSAYLSGENLLLFIAPKTADKSEETSSSPGKPSAK
jgi:hypothetical protein